MIGVSLKHLRYFDALARRGHFGRAAEDCAVTQPALSMQIRDLERLVRAPLIERGARRVRLTDLGEAFAARAKEILRAVDELDELARAARGGFVGQLRLGVVPTIAPYLLPRLIGALGAHFPELELQPRETVTRTLIVDLLEARLDAAILALPAGEPSLREMALFEEEFVLIRPLADSGRPVPDADGLSELRLLLLEEGHCFRDQALSWCSASGSQPRAFMESSSLSTLVQMVGAGIGVTLIPEMALETETRAAPVDAARLAPPRPGRTVGLAWRRASPLSAQMERIGEVVRRVGLERRTAPGGPAPEGQR